jgi:hypothetical protein
VCACSRAHLTFCKFFTACQTAFWPVPWRQLIFHVRHEGCLIAATATFSPQVPTITTTLATQFPHFDNLILSLVSVVNDCGLDGQGSNRDRGRVFCLFLPHQHWNPLNLPSNGLRGPSPEVKWSRCNLTTYLQLVQKSRKSGDIPPLPHTPSRNGTW